jgi:hypothetical protein
MASQAVASKALRKVLTTPSKIANGFDWKNSATNASVAVMNVHADRLDVAIRQHPCSSSLDTSSEQQQRQHSIALNAKKTMMKRHRRVPSDSREELKELVKQHNVCGFVVSWPVQADTGLTGAACGRTLHTIEELLMQSSSSSSSTSSSDSSGSTGSKHHKRSSSALFTDNRKLCLWDISNENNDNANIESSKTGSQNSMDEFGRSPVYARRPSMLPSSHDDDAESSSSSSSQPYYRYSSKEERYHEDETIEAKDVWENFVRHNWPETTKEIIAQQRPPKSKRPSLLSTLGKAALRSTMMNDGPSSSSSANTMQHCYRKKMAAKKTLIQM